MIKPGQEDTGRTSFSSVVLVPTVTPISQHICLSTKAGQRRQRNPSEEFKYFQLKAQRGDAGCCGFPPGGRTLPYMLSPHREQNEMFPTYEDVWP